MPYSRRDFIRSAAAFGALALLPKPLFAFENDTAADFVADYLTAMDMPYTAPLNYIFERIVGRDKVGLLLYDVNDGRLMAALSPENPLPVASAFKAPLLMYFLDVVDRDVWSGVPVQHWNAVGPEVVPEEFRDASRRNFVIRRALWQMLALSDNATTGQVLSYVANAQGRTDAVAAFNDWAASVVGTSQISGLSGWNQGVDAGHTATDARFDSTTVTIDGVTYTLPNMMTPRDIGLFYMWMLQHFDADQKRTAFDMLSVIHNDRPANLERLALAHDGTPYSKNGSLETDAGYVVADAGLMSLPNNRDYLLVLLTLGVPLKIEQIFEELDGTLAGRYNEVFHNKYVDAVDPAELLATYTAHLQVAYTQQTDPFEVPHRYGFIMPSGVEVFRHPREDVALHNPIIKSTLFGVHLLMQGALVRFVDVDADWVELVPDDHRDNVRNRLGVQMFVRRRDVWPISMGYADLLPYLIDPTTQPDEKYIVINLGARELVAFEGETPVMRVPIVLNPDATPRGAQVITSKWFARSMQPWAPGVPFTSFFGAEGYALHGSPWQRWNTTVNHENIFNRSSAGCVNVPDWMITVGEHHRPADELLFRWVGGMDNPQTSIWEFPSERQPALRIFNVDYPQHLNDYVRPQGMVSRGLAWGDVIELMGSIPLQAPDSFYV